QQRRATELAIAVVDARGQLAAQPGEEEHLLGAGTELALPALAQVAEQWPEQLLGQGADRVERQHRVETVIQTAFVELDDAAEHFVALTYPVIAAGGLGLLAMIEQRPDLAAGDAASEPGKDGVDSLEVGRGI